MTSEKTQASPFREKSLERVSSPEQLDEYLRVANPGVWMVLLAIVVLLAGVCAWGVLGHLDTTAAAVAVCENGQVSIYVAETEDAQQLTGCEVEIGELRGTVTAVSRQSLSAGEALSDYACHVGGFGPEDWVYVLQTDIVPEDGIYAAQVVTERISPMSFLVN